VKSGAKGRRVYPGSVATLGALLLFVALLLIGLWDQFWGANGLVVFTVVAFIIAAGFNTWSSLTEEKRGEGSDRTTENSN